MVVSQVQKMQTSLSPSVWSTLLQGSASIKSNRTGFLPIWVRMC